MSTIQIWSHWSTLYSAVGSNQVGCSCTWQRYLSCVTNTGATEEIQAFNHSWRGCNHPTSNGPYQGYQGPYLVPRTAKCLPPLWSNTDHWPYATGVCSVTRMWRILHNWLIECSLETIPETCTVEFLREVGFLYLIWTVKHSITLLIWTTRWPDAVC